MDVVATDWQAGANAVRRRPLQTTGVLVLLLSGAVVVVHWRNRRRGTNTLKFRTRIVLPTGLVMALALMVYTAHEYQRTIKDIRQDMLDITEQVRNEWGRHVASEVQSLRTQIDHIGRNPAMLKAWQERDLAKLTELAQPVHAQLKRDYRITHVYFMAPDRTCFLRAHQPERRGDPIDRFTLLAAQRTGEDSWGTELGPLGAFTLRYVRPWKQDGRILGYLELGMEIEHLVEKVAQDMNLDLATIIHKECTSREKFEAGCQAVGFPGQWDTYPDFVVTHQPAGNLPEELEDWIKKHHDGPVAENGMFSNHSCEDCVDHCVIHLRDCAGRDVADLIVMRNVTAKIAVARSDLSLHLGLAFVLFGSILVLLWSVTGVVEKQLGAAFAQVRGSNSHLAQLKSLECEFGQGYLFSKPLMADQAAEFRVRPGVLPGQAA